MIHYGYLKDHAEFIPQLAEIWYEVLGKIWLPNVKIEQVIKNFENHLNKDFLPLTIVAIQGTTPIGMCSLRNTDGIRPDLSPWLGSLIVHPQYQHQGIGKELITRIQNIAKSMNFQQLYLFAFDPTIPEWYIKLNWSIFSMDKFKGHPVTVMSIYL